MKPMNGKKIEKINRLYSPLMNIIVIEMSSLSISLNVRVESPFAVPDTNRLPKRVVDTANGIAISILNMWIIQRHPAELGLPTDYTDEMWSATIGLFNQKLLPVVRFRVIATIISDPTSDPSWQWTLAEISLMNDFADQFSTEFRAINAFKNMQKLLDATVKVASI